MLFIKISNFGKNYPSALRKVIGFATVSILKFSSSSWVLHGFNLHFLITAAVVEVFQCLLTCGFLCSELPLIMAASSMFLTGCLSVVCIYVCMLSHVRLFAIPWTVTHHNPLSMRFCRQEYWSGLPFPPLGDLPDPGIESVSPVSSALVGGFFTTEPPGKPFIY